MKDHNHVVAESQLGFVLLVDCAKQPFDAVARRRAFHASLGSKPDARGRQSVWQDADGEQWRTRPRSSSLDRQELFRESEPLREVRWRRAQAGRSCQRPFRRRRRRTLRPARVLIRVRNP